MTILGVVIFSGRFFSIGEIARWAAEVAAGGSAAQVQPPPR